MTVCVGLVVKTFCAGLVVKIVCRSVRTGCEGWLGKMPVW